MTNDADERALRELIGRIESTFGVDMDGWLGCFASPMVLVTPAGTLSMPDVAAARAQFEPMWSALADRGFHATVADTVVVRLVGDDLALVDAAFTRRRADGSELERVGALYVCRRTGDGWIVATLISHPAEVAALDG